MSHGDDHGSGSSVGGGGGGGTGRGGEWGGYDFNTNNNIGRAKGSKADGGGSWGSNNAGRNTSWGINPRTGALVQTGAPSWANGMMTTAAGYNMNRMANWDAGGLGLSSYGISDKRSPFYSGYYENLQRNIKADAQARRDAEDSVRSSIDKSALNWPDRDKALTALKEGKLGELDELGIDTTSMQTTHRSPGMMGMIGDFFGAKKNDVDTMGEVEAETPGTGLNPMGFGVGMLAPAVAEQVYGLTENVPAALAAKKATGFVAGKMSPSVPDAAKYAAKALGFAGVPVAGQLANAVGLISQARDLNYIGRTNPNGPAKANENYGSGGMMSTPEAVTAAFASGEGKEPDLAGQWQYLFGVPWSV